ncbi:dystonin [Gastrophryne carolinensis]
MIAAVFLVLLRPYSIQCAVLLLLLMLGTLATIAFLYYWHRKLYKSRHPIRNVFSYRPRSRDAILRSHHFRSEGFRPSPRHLRRYTRTRVEEAKPLVEVQHTDQDTASPLRKRKIKRSSRVQPEFYQTVQVTPVRKLSSGTASYRCSMSSSADFSDDEDLSQRSGSACSPAPGDTLPWNLPRHKRKSSGAASVLDPAERAVLRIADERDKVQKKTFTKWVNQHLLKVRKHVDDLYEDLRDGHNLISLLEVLSGHTLPRERDFLKTLRLVSSSEACEFEQHEDVEDEDKGPREKGRMRFHRLQNVQIALDYLKKRQVKLVNIRNDDITDGNPKLTLGLIWTIILHFQISDIHVTGESEDMSAKEKLLLWTQQATDGYSGIRCENFTTCWRDGRLFNAIIHKYRPDLIDLDTVAVQSNNTNLENAFHVAEKLGVPRLLDPEDVDVSSPDEKSVITYVSSMYDVFPKTPEGGEGIGVNDVEVKWIEYQNMVNYLIQWIKHHVKLMSERNFPNTAVELKALYNQYLQFKEKDIPPKETEKGKIKHLYTLLEPWVEFGRLKLSQGYHPNDIEKEWAKLIIAMFEREKAIRPEIERLDMLQQIATRVQRDSLGCEDKLILARSALQADTKRMESGIQFQNESEIAGYLIECENLLRQQLVDVQTLVDGKYYQADQLVQRVGSLRDELLALRNEYSSLYSKGRMVSADQTQLMISGISQSLNSGFSQSINPAMNSSISHNMVPMSPTSLNPGISSSMTPGISANFNPGISANLSQGVSSLSNGLQPLTPGLPSNLGSNFSQGFNSHVTPGMTPTFAPNFNQGLVQNYATGMNSNAMQSLKLMQVKKPMLKSSFADQNLPEEEVNLKFVQDLFNWVEEMQMQLDRGEWGSDLSSIEVHLENHRNFHGGIEEFETSLKEAKMSEVQMTGPLKSSYSETLQKVEGLYSKLLNSSRNRQKYLESLHNFVTKATRELIWLNEKEEEEVAYDWSDRNQNISAKKDYHADLMRELDHKEEVIKSVQDTAEHMLLQNHPARSTIEAYKAALQTQWSWILQLCSCVEQHIRQNTAYFEYFKDAKEATDYLKTLKDSILRKYSCDKSTSVHKLEDLVQESMEEKEQLLQYKNTVASLVGRSKSVIQLKPRNPENTVKSSISIKAICDYRQIEITIYKDDECVLANNLHRAKWKVISPTGNEAMVPSVCFTVPPPNKEAVDSANRIEQMYQSVLSLWHESHINMKSTVSWHYLMNEIEAIRSSKVSSIKTLLPGEHQQVLSNLKSRFDDFLEDSQESKIFSVSDISQLEREVNVCKLYYEELLKSAEREEQEESLYNLYTSEIRNFRLRLESCEERLIRQIRTPLDRDDLHESVLRISEQEKLKKELDHLKVDLSAITDKCEEFFSQAAASPAIESLQVELNTVIQTMSQMYSMSSIYLEKLRTINLVLKHTQGAETLVKTYETKLCEEDVITADRSSTDRLIATLKQWRSEVDEKREVFHALEDELQKAKSISDQMLKVHKERDLDFDWHKEKADQIAERWQNVHSQIENRLRDLDGISKSLKYYKESYLNLDSWIRQMEETQSKLQDSMQDSKSLSKLLEQQKALISEIEMKQSKMDECQKYSEQYSLAIKDYELQLMTYRALVDSHQKSPMKRRRFQSSSDVVVQEYMDLRTRYTALMTLFSQFIKFSGETLKRLEEEERSLEEEKKEHIKKAGDILNWVSNLNKTLSKEGGSQDSPEKMPISEAQVSATNILTKQEEAAEALQTLQLHLAKHGDRMTEEEKSEIETQIRGLQESQTLLSKEYERQQQESRDLMEKLVEQKDAEMQLQEHKGKLQEICNLLTQTENKLIGQQSIALDSPTDLQNCQSEYEELQKDMQAGASELAEIVKNTEKFLQEHSDKLTHEERVLIEQKLKEAKSKFQLLQKKAEESKKDLEKAVTKAIKKETEKSVAVEQLEESRNKIESLMGWLSHVEEEGENGNQVKRTKLQQNGTHDKESESQSILDGVKEVNGNMIESDGKASFGKYKDLSSEEDLNSQYQKVKAQHEKLLSQHQAVIIATQSAQALLEKQGRHLTPEEKEKLQKNIEALKGKYDSALRDSERKMKVIQTVQEELEKFVTDYNEFENWLKDSKQELEHLEKGSEDFAGIRDKLQRQKNFSEDVISHKGDLRYITISGQRVLDAAKSCSQDEVVEDNNNVSTLETCKMVQSKLDMASENFKSLHTKCNNLGNNLKDLVDKYEHYKEAASELLTGLQNSETAVQKRISEPIAADTRNLQRQLEETKMLCEQVSVHQVAVEKLKKASEGLLVAKEGLLLSNEEIQKPLDDVVGKYNNLSQSVNDWNEKLQITLTRSLSVQDGLNEMFDWMQGVEKDLKEQQQVPLNSTSIQEIIAKNNMLQQDITSRQSSITTMNEKVKKFMETADSSAASLLQGKMNELSERFSKASELTRAHTSKMEDLKNRVEQYEDLSDKLQTFLDKKSKALMQTDVPGKDVTELSQYMKETSNEVQENKKSLEDLHRLVEELCMHALPGDKALVLEKVNSMSKRFQDLEEAVKAKEEDVSSCQNQMDTFLSLVQSLKHWFTTINNNIPPVAPILCLEELYKRLEETKSLQEDWTQKSPDVQKVNSQGSLLCNLITAVTSPAKSRSTGKSGRSMVNGSLSSVAKENLANKELALVQKGMLDVNEGYDHLGKLLKDRISELESWLPQLKQIQEESSSLVQWLEKMHAAAVSWEAPTDSESVRAHVEQHKVFAAEVKQNESKVKSLKDKLEKLIENNSSVPEAQHWKDILNKIESSWKDITQMTAERQQTLEESSNDLTQFQTAEAQLKQWLVEKELMASVLGPLSIDPNMLKTQKQQVQILLKEFDARKQQYEQLTSAGQRILSRPGELPPCDEAVREQLAAVACKWERLTGQLNDRCDRIDQAIVMSTNYQNLLNGLSEKLSALNCKLNSNIAIGAAPDAVKQKLNNAEQVQEEINLEQANIDSAKALCDELSHLVAEEYLKAELKRQMDTTVKQFMDLKEKAGVQVDHLQSAFASSQKFYQMSEDFQCWMESKRKEQAEAAPISANLEIIESLIAETKELKTTLNTQHCAYENIIAEGENLLQRTEGEEKAKLQSQLSMLKSGWSDINKKISDRENSLSDCHQKAIKYRDIVGNIQPWIKEYQNKISEVKTSTDPAAVESSIGEIKALQKSIDKQRGMVEMLNSAADSLFNSCGKDKEIIRNECALLNDEVESLVDSLHCKKDSLESMALRLKDFQESVKDAEKQLAMVQEHLDVHDSLGTQAYSNKHLTIMQTQEKTLQSLEPQVQHSVKLAQELVIDASDAEGASDLLLQADSLQHKHDTLSRQVEEKCSFLETKLQGIGHFQHSIREMFSQFAELDDELDSMSPVARDLETLQTQKQNISSFLQKLGELIKNNDNFNKTCKKMMATETSPDLVGIKRDLEALSKQCNKLLDRAKSREETIDATFAKMKDFYNTLKQFVNELGTVEEHEESQGPVGMETDVINNQLSMFKTFQKEEIEPLQTHLQEVNWLGQGLVQSAAKNTSTESLEHDLEEVNTRWNALNKKISQRSAQLQEALLQCGRFQDALESILSWLVDTEDLVANQKSPSAEFKVVKAQIQEQKLLQRLLDDRKPTIDVIKREGEKIAVSADQADKEKILKQFNTLERRWDELLKKAEIRNRQLEGILVVAEQFHDTLEPLSEWLSNTEKKLANAEPVGTQTSKLLDQISQHKALQEDITAQNTLLRQSLSIGQTLKGLSSIEEKEMVQEKLDICQLRYMEIQERSSRRYDLLQQAHCNAQIFGDDEVELMNWLTEVHDKLSKLSVQDYNTDVLTRQHTELLLLQEEILLRKLNVDQAILNGLELLKQTTGDEVVIIQEKLDGIKSRYSEITKLSFKVSKALEQALNLATQFHLTHEQLSHWLDKVEVELKNYDLQDQKSEDLNIIQEQKKELQAEAKTNKALLDSINEVSSALLELVPWRVRGGLDKMVTEDNDRYRLVNDTLTQMVEEIDAARLRSQQFEQAVGAEQTWITETKNKIMALGHIRLEQDQTAAQLQVQKGFTMEILRHKDIIDELVNSGDEILSIFSEEERHTMENALRNLQKRYDDVCHLNAERNQQLERAVSLANQFWETCEELWPWLTETEKVISELPPPGLNYDTLRQQQEDIRQLRELIAEHKPHIDKMNKTGPQLVELSPEEGFCIQEKYVSADALYTDIKEVVKKRAIALDEAISQSSQFHDKIEPTLESLQRIAERLRQPPSISAECEKIREQISENKNVSVELEKLLPVYETLKMRGEEMIARSEGADKDISAKAVQDKLDQMVFIWEDIQALTEEREAHLLDVLELAEKFWCDHIALIATIKDTQEYIQDLDEPGVDPSIVKQQQEAAEALKEEIDGLQEELDLVISLGSELISACGEPDKPVVNKSIDELNSIWDMLNKTWKERIEKLDDAMQAAVQYQDGLQALFDWVDIATGRMETMPPIGTDLDTVKQQINELKQFKTEAYQQQIELERLNHQKELLQKRVTDEIDKQALEDSFKELKYLWQALENRIVNRQHKLEAALLALGPFQHALDELLTWMTHTEGLLNEQRSIGGDPKTIEIELAKHHVLQNDVLAHQSTVETVQKAGNDLIESSAGEEASSLRSRLDALSHRWKNVLDKTEQRRNQLDNALLLAQGFHSEIEEMHQWLSETERHLLASKPVGGLPETAREQLNTHLELCAAFETKEEVYKSIMLKSQHMLQRNADDPEASMDQDINNLKEKWQSVETKISEQKTKLEEAVSVATEFHNSLQDFINWLTQAEQMLTMASPPSLILDTVLFQIDEHKVFVTEINSHRDQIMELDKTGTHLKYFSQKQDVVIIKNLLISVQSRWESVVQRSLERGRALDDARKKSKQFHEAFTSLTEWLEESEKSLDSELEIANDPDRIKTQLAAHKEFQKTLGAKHSVYDSTARNGRLLKEKASLNDDIQKLDDMLSEIRDRWDTVCGKSVERQNKLEEALLFSGQFTDALQALIDWLYRVEPQLAEDQPVHGDIDLVMNLLDNHKVFQKELGKRSTSIQALKRSARELIEGSRDDSSWVKAQMQELGTRWETVCSLSVSKQIRLEEALRQAEEFHSAVHILLEWLAEAEQTLRFHGVLPDDEDSLKALIEQHKEFMRKLEEKRTELNNGERMGDSILSVCHPDSSTTIKHWITIIRARFEEVLTWAKQHHQRLATALDELISKKELLESLLQWLQWAETTLNEKDKEEIPDEIDEVKALIEEHQAFMEEMTRKQPDVDKVTKTYKRKAAESTSAQSQIPILDKGRTGRKRSPTPNLYPSGTQAPIETKNPRVNLLVTKWQHVWLLALERRRNLNDALDRLEELKEFANFDFDVWRKKYMRWMNHKKSRVMDFFRRIDKDQDGKITRQEFIEGILSSKFPTSRLEMSAVADIFDRDGDGYIDYYEFVAALHPNKDAYKPVTDADKIEDEVTRQVAKCKCAKRFQVEQIGDNKYRFFLGNQFGDSQQLRLVRILRSTVMVRVGGGWMALDEFLVKNDPCRVHHHGSKMLRSESNSSIATQPLIELLTRMSENRSSLHYPAKGRTNVELREKFMLPEGVSQSMTPFRPKGRRSRPSSRGGSPNRSNSSPNTQASPSQNTGTSTPKTPLHITRNYGKPWLTNSKSSTPCKSPEPPEHRPSSDEGTPIQGSKLRLPGYLSGKGFHSAEDSTLPTTASPKPRAHFADLRKTPSRAASKAGSRSSSRRGSDASDFDISEIQSVCSDMSEIVHDGRPSPRASSRSSTGRPSKIPTPQRRSPMSKLATTKTTKR